MSSIASDDDLLTVPEAATVLKVSPVTVSRWLRQGRLPAYRLGPRAVRIRRSELAAVFSPARSQPATTASQPEGESAVAAASPASASSAGGDRGATGVASQLAALTAAAALREQILVRRKGAPLPPLEGDRKRGKRS